jgi:hypothetical protein
MAYKEGYYHLSVDMAFQMTSVLGFNGQHLADPGINKTWIQYGPQQVIYRVPPPFETTYWTGTSVVGGW